MLISYLRSVRRGCEAPRSPLRRGQRLHFAYQLHGDVMRRRECACVWDMCLTVYMCLTEFVCVCRYVRCDVDYRLGASRRAPPCSDDRAPIRAGTKLMWVVVGAD